MSQLFDKLKVAGVKNSTFDLSHDQITTSDFGYLIPICYRDMVPNDDFVVTPDIFTRLAPMAAPAFGRIVCRVHHFFVPYRILYPNWENFITQSPNNYTIPPYFTASALKQRLNVDPQFSNQTTTFKRGIYGRLMSNLGLNPMTIMSSKFSGDERISAFPFLAYYRIWMDYFMDSSLNDHASMDLILKSQLSGGGSIDNYVAKFLVTQSVCYKKDYYTTAKLNPQDGVASIVGADLANAELNPALHHATTAFTNIGTDGSKVSQNNTTAQANATSKIAQFTVEALRAASSLQRYLERNNFVGSKLINRLLVHFGVSPTAERLDMAEWLDGETFQIQVGDVTSHNSTFDNASSTYSTYGLGMQAGKGWGRSSRNPKSVRYHAAEHGIFMSVMSILPDTSYYQGVPRIWQKGVTGEPLDFYNPEFENLGYQELLNKEVFVPFGTASNYSDYDGNGVFGWTPRYSEYKFAQDVLAGDMVGRPVSTFNAGTLLDSWHLFRKLNFTNDSPLALNNNFVELVNHNTDYDRIFQLTDSEYDHFYFNIHMDIKATRPMVGFAEPSLDLNNEGEGNTITLPYGGTRL